MAGSDQVLDASSKCAVRDKFMAPHLHFLGKTPLVLAQQGVMHALTGLPDPVLGGGGRGVLLPGSAPEHDHHSKSHTRGAISNTWDTKKRNQLQLLIPKVCFSRLGGCGKGGSIRLLAPLLRTAALPLLPSAGPVSVPVKNHSIHCSHPMCFLCQ